MLQSPTFFIVFVHSRKDAWGQKGKDPAEHFPKTLLLAFVAKATMAAVKSIFFCFPIFCRNDSSLTNRVSLAGCRFVLLAREMPIGIGLSNSPYWGNCSTRTLMYIRFWKTSRDFCHNFQKFHNYCDLLKCWAIFEIVIYSRKEIQIWDALEAFSFHRTEKGVWKMHISLQRFLLCRSKRSQLKAFLICWEKELKLRAENPS